MTLRARTAIVTLPAGVLRRRGEETAVTFDPELPTEKRRSLEFIEMGHVVKVSLAFETPFWESIAGGRYREASFFYCEERPFPTYWTQVPVRSELLTAWVGGPKATALGGMPAPDLIELARDGFAALLHEPDLTRTQFLSGMVHDWSADVFAGGAYSYVTVGGEKARAGLAAPVGATLFFAGEASSTDGQGGTVNRALKTGERAAAEVAAELGIDGV
ncbi:MAG: FAD-dependent oxidoreductase, partial [Candidatus Eremiobacteraeota bacterium]|nr:FAD-dependent oxidoreductase [Candidatus Eremiobacteraeota bacterium]